ncbi:MULTISPECIES: hypothetical protein [unclassified Streptomyces]|uniref:hypothetical protein n=1 Tax=unclassified Streptomyces TaxID=2593676 RepID=UPI002DD885D8|nr:MULTISPECIES: hypothetical protein [unclassified Streptomyces]WSA92656.1 hypothetical protein OIE63_14600 [Streptomyces sp. NBC_01795]WSB77022.1 hypothetical protein OHB04_15405 [Streptomyces sp. NBC_01775]WSS14706.1 hypothetical protein OG533_24540 [Streptomyces sp. NBC_01186]WSS43535.1 hypothetical protein OG220_25290 [Streptomyces sp. NBC_01187]
MENITDTLVTALVLAVVTAALLLPPLLGQRREWRVDRELRAAERGARLPPPPRAGTRLPAAREARRPWIRRGRYADASGGGSGVRRTGALAAIHLTPAACAPERDSAGTCGAA